MTAPEPDGITVPVVWVVGDDLPVRFANHFLGQVVAHDEAVLSFGQLVPPPLLGSPDDRREQAEGLSFIPVHAIARLAMNRQRLEELRRVIEETLKNHDTLFPKAS
jgi:hypothetical protein